MTGRERLLTVLRGGIPDCVPVAPDFSNMIPARLTGKPFWGLSTGDQCGRDTPAENLHAMVETARTYGRYREDGSVVGCG